MPAQAIITVLRLPSQCPGEKKAKKKEVGLWVMLSYTKTDAAFYIPSTTSPIVITKRESPSVRPVRPVPFYTNYPLPNNATHQSINPVEKNRRQSRLLYLLPIPQPPSRLERCNHVVLGANAIARQAADAVRAAADSL